MNTRSKLFVMLLLEYFIWGAWLPLIFGYLPSLGFEPAQHERAGQLLERERRFGIAFYLDRQEEAPAELRRAPVVEGRPNLGALTDKLSAFAAVDYA